MNKNSLHFEKKKKRMKDETLSLSLSFLLISSVSPDTDILTLFPPAK